MSVLKAIIATIVIAGTTFFVVNKNGEVELQTPEVVQSQFYDEAGEYFVKEKIVYDKLAEANVTSSEEVNNVIPASASFDITFDNDVTKEYVENTFSIKPAKKTEVVELNKKYYKLTVVNGLEEDQIYNVEEKTTSGTKKWAFQTEKVFKVEYTYPENNGFLTETGAPEIRFNSTLAKGVKLDNYITISPSIGGEWKSSYSYNYRFEHNKHFEPGKTYEITVKKGLKDIDGNELKEDYSFKFQISNEEDISANLAILNVYKPNTNMDLTLNLSLNMNKALTIKNAKLKIINLGSKEEYIKAINDITYIEKLKAYNETKNYKVTFEKDLKDIVTNAYNSAKAEKRYWYSDEIPLDLNLSISEQGYYLAILDINSNLSSSLFQVNEASATVSTLSNHNFMMLYKGNNGQNNSVDVYINNEKLGSTDGDGLLYIENFRDIIKNIDKDVNYAVFKTGNVDLVVDLSSQLFSEFLGENYLTSLSRFNNGYAYVDRNSYKPGETIYYWGYAKNRKVKVENATLKITSNWDDVLTTVPLKLSEAGTFEGEFTLDNVDKESYITLELYIGENVVSQRGVQVRDYELKQYNISIKPESNKYLDGETAVINITAETYDGTPLKDLEFSYKTGSNYSYYDENSKKVDGKVTTDEFGMATIKVPLKLSKAQTNIMPETVGVTILNSYIDGEQAREYFTVYPYKHYAEGQVKFIVDENKYYISLKEYLSLDNEVPANDSIKVVAKAYKTVRSVVGTRYNKYTKEMEDIVEYNEVAESKYDKTFTIKMSEGKGNYELENYSKDKNCYYRFYAYLITDTGKELALSYNGQIYSSSYKTIYDEREYEEVEYVDPIITPELTYTLVYENNDKLKVGDEVNFYLRDEEGRRLNDYSKFDFYTLVVSADGNNIYRNKGEAPHFTFTKEMGANVSTYTICYDTIKTYVPTANNRIFYSSYMMIDSYYIRPSAQIRLCDEELSLNVDVKFDKETYEPKDEAVIKIKVTDQGKGVKAGINISALDTAYIDANGSVDTNIISSLFNSYIINSSSNNTKGYSRGAYNTADMAVAQSAKMAANESFAVMEEAEYDSVGGGGGDEESLTRDDLRITAFFESLVTDENGEVEVRIKLPDNITEWTIKVQAIADNYKAVAEEKKIKVSKDFFVNINHKDRYLVGENFAFNIKSFSKLYAGQDVKFDIEILDENNNVIEKGNVNSKAQDVLSYKVQKPISKVGTYKLKVTGTCNGIKDILIDEIDVVDSLLDATVREDLIVKIGDKIGIVSNKGYIYILNEEVAKILPTLFELSFLYNSDRNDVAVISSEAQRILNNLYEGNEFEYSKKSSYEAEKNIFKVMKNSSDDARLALKMLSTKAIRVASEEALDKVEVRLGECARLWAKVNMDMCSLKELREKKNDLEKNTSSYKVEDALYLALAFADMGSFDEAQEIYDVVKAKIKDNNENEFELKVILAIKLNRADVDELYNSYIAKQEEMLPENYNFIKLYYIQNMLSKNFKKGSVTLKINGVEEVVEVKNIGFTRKLIAGKDDIELVAMTDNLSFMIEQYKPVDFASIEKGKYIISKTYSNKNYKEGDILEVSIKIDNKKLYDDGQKYGFKVEDAIPNNMTFVEMLYGKDLNGYLRKQDGQKLTITVWNPYDPKWNPSATTSTLKYKVRVTNSGEQYEPGTILVKYNNQIIDGIK